MSDDASRLGQARNREIPAGVAIIEVTLSMLRSSILQSQRLAFAFVLLLGASAVVLGNQQNDDSLLSQARELATRKNWSEAEALARRYLQTKTDSGDGHALLGYIFFNQQRAKESMAEYVEAARHRDLTASELKTFALDCAELHLFVDADKWLTRSVEVNPEDAKGWAALGQVKFEEQRYEESITAYDRSLALAPRSVSAETGKGLSYELLGRLEDSGTAYKTALEWEAHDSRDPTPFNGLGRVLLKQNKPADALPYLRKAVELGPTVARAHEDLGKAYSSLNQLTAAQSEIEKAIELAPSVARLHFILGQLYRKTGQMEKSREELKSYGAMVGTSSTPAVDPK